MDAVLECCIILVHVDRIIGPHCLSNAQINFRTLGIDENLICSLPTLPSPSSKVHTRVSFSADAGGAFNTIKALITPVTVLIRNIKLGPCAIVVMLPPRDPLYRPGA